MEFGFGKGLVSLGRSLFNYEVKKRGLGLPSLKAVSLGNLEKHLSDVRQGKGNLSKNTSLELSTVDLSNASQLARQNPRAASLYGGYLSALPYEQRSRFVSNIYDANQNLSTLNDVVAKTNNEQKPVQNQQ